MANMNPAGLFPNMNINLPAPVAGEMQWRMANEGLNQAAMQSRLGQLEEQRARMALEQAQANVPLQNIQREVAMGQGRGQLERLPYESAAATADAKFKASPNFIETTQQIEIAQQNEKKRMMQFKQNADEMDIFAQAINPVMERLQAGDVAGANEAWSEAGELLGKHGVDVKQLQKIPMTQLAQRYQQAIKTAPLLRRQYEQWENNERQKELERIKHQAKLAEKKAGVDDKLPANPNAVLARIQNKYRNDPDSVTDPEIGLFREALETNILKNSEELEDNLWNDAGKQIADEDAKKGTTVKSNRGTRIRSRYNQLRKQFFDQLTVERYPELAKRQGVTAPAQPKERVIDFSQLRRGQ